MLIVNEDFPNNLTDQYDWTIVLSNSSSKRGYV